MAEEISETLKILSERGLSRHGQSVRGLLADVVNISTFSSKTAYVWRGQDFAGWEPNPGLYRRIRASRKVPRKRGRGIIWHLEKNLLTDVRTAGYISDTGTANNIADLATLTHYGAATRLLDVTIDPMTALWFAVQDESRWDEDGVVYAFDAAQLDESPIVWPPGSRKI